MEVASDFIAVLNSQLVRLDRRYGSEAVSFDLLRSIRLAIEHYQGPSEAVELLVPIVELYRALHQCWPRMAHIINDLQELIFHLSEHPNLGRQDVLEFLQRALQRKETFTDRCVSETLRLFDKPVTLLLHSYSGVILEVLDALVDNEHKPRVVVASQEWSKTERLLKFLKRKGFDCWLVSEHSIIHVLPQIDFALFGALTLTVQEEVIIGPGSAGIISQLNHAGLPVYAILSTRKFSFWQEDLRPAFHEVRTCQIDSHSYEEHVYSHDIVDLEQLTAIITERGCFEPGIIRQVYGQLAERFNANEERMVITPMVSTKR